MNKFNGFTLAEVLITLGIIGIVAAMTLPTLVAKYKDKVLVAQGKKLYSETLNGIKMYMVQNDCADESCLFDTSKTTNEVNREFFKVLDGAIYCEKNNKRDICKDYKILANKKQNNGYGQTSYGDQITQPYIALKSGAIIKIIQNSQCIKEVEVKKRDENGNFIIGADGKPETEIKTNDICAYIYLDSNGHKGPNQVGADVFPHYISSHNKLNLSPYFQDVLIKGKLNYTPYNVGVEY